VKVEPIKPNFKAQMERKKRNNPILPKHEPETQQKIDEKPVTISSSEYIDLYV
jgi:hypothetical protein